MADAVENGDIKENFVEDELKVDVEATSVNLDCVKTEPNEGTLDFKEDNHSTQYKITLKYEDIYGESSHQIKIKEDYDNLIGFLDKDVIMENAMIKLEAVKEEDDGSFNNFYCRNCKGIYKDYCLKCSTLLRILNNMSIASFKAESNTIPTDILEIRATSRGKGVYLLRTLPIHIIFGPFEGIVGIESTIGHSWKVIDNKLMHINSANWMKNIVCAASVSLKNLDIFQIDGNLYFQTNREITEGEELLIYYDDAELQQLDNSKECLYTPQKQEQLPKIFACTVCCLGFGLNKCLMEHKGKYCRMEHSRGMDEFVLIECHYCKMWMEKWEHEEYHAGYCLEKHHRMWSDYSKGVDRSDADVVEEMGKGDCSTRDGKGRYPGGDIYSRSKDRRDDLKFNTEDYQCLSGGNQETRLNKCGALLERSNNEQTQNNTIATNNSHHLHKNLNKHKGGGGSIKPFKCDICVMTFTQKGTLKAHIKNKHTGDANGKDYKCLECSFETNYKSNFQTHLNKHKGIKRFQCDICMMKFSWKDHLKIHVKNKHTDDGGVKDYKCLECFYLTNNKSNFQTHLNKHNVIKRFQCDICMMKFTRKGYLKLHIRNKHTDDGGVKEYKCLECSYQTNNKSNFQTHLNKHKGIKPFQCAICMMTFTAKASLKAHIKNKHTGDANGKDYKCLECSYETNYKHDLKSHMKDKHAEDNAKDYQCLEYSYETNYKHYLKSHMKNKHADNAKDYQCLECSFATNYKSNFQAHLNKHNGIKPFQCDICMMKFTWKGHLKVHIKNKHTDDGGVKDYKCLECSFETNYKSNFQTHLNKHKGIKRFQCDICMMKFTQKGHLKVHVKNKHTDDGGVKDYKCLECFYQTNNKSNLQTHLNEHKGNKPFKCDICLMKFTRKGSLKHHIKNKHTNDANGKDYKCLECSYQSYKKSDLQRHLNMHKGIKRFRCEICMMKFTQKRTLTKHIKNKHADDKSVKD